MRHERMVARVARGAEILHVAGNRVGHAVRQMHTGIAEADAGIRRRQNHLLARLVVGRIFDGANKVLGDHAQRLQRPDIADRIRALVGRTQRRARRPRTRLVTA